MNEKVKSEKRIPSVAESIIGLLLVSAAVLIGLKLGIGSQMALFLGAVVAILVALFFRVPWSEIQATFARRSGNKHPHRFGRVIMHGRVNSFPPHGHHSDHTLARLVVLPGRMGA